MIEFSDLSGLEMKRIIINNLTILREKINTAKEQMDSVTE